MVVDASYVEGLEGGDDGLGGLCGLAWAWLAFEESAWTPSWILAMLVGIVDRARPLAETTP